MRHQTEEQCGLGAWRKEVRCPPAGPYGPEQSKGHEKWIYWVRKHPKGKGMNPSEISGAVTLQFTVTGPLTQTCPGEGVNRKEEAD